MAAAATVKLAFTRSRAIQAADHSLEGVRVAALLGIVVGNDARSVHPGSTSCVTEEGQDMWR